MWHAPPRVCRFGSRFVKFSDPSMGAVARPSPARTVAWFAAVHLAMLAACYGLAVVQATGHELARNEVGHGQVEHLGRMLLLPVKLDAPR